MKTTLLALTFLTLGQAAFAGGLAEPVPEPAMAPAVVEEQAGSSAQGIVVPLLLLAVIAAVVAD